MFIHNQIIVIRHTNLILLYLQQNILLSCYQCCFPIILKNGSEWFPSIDLLHVINVTFCYNKKTRFIGPTHIQSQGITGSQFSSHLILMGNPNTDLFIPKIYSKEPNLITLKAKDEQYQDLLGKPHGLSFQDIHLAHLMYKCNGKLNQFLLSYICLFKTMSRLVDIAIQQVGKSV